MEGRAVEDAAAAEPEVRQDVRVRVDEAEHRAVRKLPWFNLSLHKGALLREGHAARLRRESEHRGSIDTVGESPVREQTAALPVTQVELPVRRRALQLPFGLGDEGIIPVCHIRF